MTRVRQFSSSKVTKKVVDVCSLIHHLTRVSLLIVLIVYCALGAYVFQQLEGPNELRKEKLGKLNGTDKRFRNRLREECPTFELDKFLNESNISSLTIQINDAFNDMQWDYYGSFFFASTVVSTIGYGNPAPATEQGQVFCVLFSLIGIPLCLLTLARIGEWFPMTSHWLSSYAKTEHGKSAIKLSLFVFWPLVLLIIPAFIYHKTECVNPATNEHWSHIQALYFDFITLTTIGLGDYTANGNCIHQKEWQAIHKCIFFAWIVLGLSFVADMIGQIQQGIVNLESYLTQKIARKTMVDASTQK